MESEIKEILQTIITWESQQEHEDIENLLMLIIDENQSFSDLHINEQSLLRALFKAL